MKSIKEIIKEELENLSDDTLKKIVEFVTKNSYLDYEGDEEGVLRFSTRDNGNTGDEEPGSADIQEAKRIGREVLKNFPGYSAKLETVDEWVSLLVQLKKEPVVNYKYKFIKHKSPNIEHAQGFTEGFNTFEDLVKKYGSWLPSVDWNRVKTELDKITDFPHNTFGGWHESNPIKISDSGTDGWGYNFSIQKLKENPKN